MKKSKKKMGRVLLAAMACTLLAGCSGSKKSSSGRVSLANGKITESSIVVSIGNEGVRYSEIRGYCYLLKKQYSSSFGTELWDYPIEKEQTVGDEAKEEILNLVTELKVIAATAKAEKVTLTADEKDEAIEQAEKVLKAASAEDKKDYCLTRQSLMEIFESNLLANKMFYIATDDADTEVSDEEARQVSIQYLHLRTDGPNENGVEVRLSEKEKQAVKKRAKKLLSEAGKTENFIEFASKNTDDKQVELLIGKEDTTLAEEAVAAVMKLKTGELSSLIEASDGYYLIYCVNENDTDATYKKKEEIIAGRQEQMFKEKYSTWLGESEIAISKSFWKIFHI